MSKRKLKSLVLNNYYKIYEIWKLLVIYDTIKIIVKENACTINIEDKFGGSYDYG